MLWLRKAGAVSWQQWGAAAFVLLAVESGRQHIQQGVRHARTTKHTRCPDIDE